ncbi:MAG: adenylate/guanylate cyclase domain-containing protein, partial [Alphaproteobacteria bacterium]|nr:adenylate/guanylate cyclase domain-containing protein [Alphaproteobacteria bacterium]
MAPRPHAKYGESAVIQKGAWLTTSRLYAGVVLYTYVSTHFLNHALGLVSLDALEAGRRVFLGLWRNWPMTILLYGALLTHACVVLYTVYRRRTLRMPRAEAVQITFGLSIPLLMATHVVGTRGVHEQAGIEDLYAYVLYSLWVSDPGLGAIQATGLVVAWVHGCIGMHTWLKLKPWYRDWIPYTYAYALVMPLLALAGFVAGGKEVMALAKDPVWRQAFLSAIKWPGPQIAEWAYMLRDAWLWFISGLLVLVFGGRMVRAITDKARMQVAFRYPDGRVIRARPGPTVLEISRAHGIPHASVCGGRGRCSTCRVRVIQGAENLPSPSEAEMGVLSRVGMPEGVRLACQIRPTQDVTVVPLLPPSAQNSDAFARPSHLAGGESEIAILFADLRGFTAFSEKRLPFDLVFVMNQYFRSMGRAVESAGGTVDKFIGDGVMALFGVGKTAAQG